MPNDAGQDRPPADISAVFSQNLKELMGASPNVPALCRKQSLPIDKYTREFRGMVLAMDTGLDMLVSRRRFMTGSFHFVATVPSL